MVLPPVATIAAPAPVLPAQPVPAQPVRAQPVPPSAPEAPATVRVAIRTDPAGAHLEVDGRSANPFVGTLSPDGRPHVVSASLPGFKMVRQSIVFDRDRDLVLTLVPGSAPTAPARPRAGPRNAASEPAGASAEKEGPGPAGYRGSKLKIETEFPGP